MTTVRFSLVTISCYSFTNKHHLYMDPTQRHMSLKCNLCYELVTEYKWPKLALPSSTQKATG